MKKLLCIVLAIVGVVVLSCVSSLGYNHYVNKTNIVTPGDTMSAQIEEAVAQVNNPTFLTVEDVFQFRQREAEKDSINLLFKSIPDDVLFNISKVVIGRNGQADKKSIAEEFRKNYKPIYQYIPSTPSTSSASSQTSKPNDTIGLPYSIRADTVINGRHFQLIKETRSNE